ncbi:MAG: CHAT domain-containing protein [Saprospiraceae bacterium]|nr:CHAT domain-containing protein [Saprospiraceae bacterium]
MRYLLIVLISSIPFSISAQTDYFELVDQVDSLLQVANVFSDEYEFDRALELILEAEQITISQLGNQSSQYKSICLLKGIVLTNKFELEESEVWLLKARNLHETIVGKDNVEYSSILTELAALYFEKEEYEQARALYEEAKLIILKHIGSSSKAYALIMTDLASLCYFEGKLDESEIHFIESKEIWDRYLDKNDLDYVILLQEFGTFYRFSGRYKEAEILYLNAKNLCFDLAGREAPDYATNLDNLANLYDLMGNEEDAELLYKEALEIRESVLGKDHPDYGASLNNYGSFLLESGQLAKAEIFLIEAKMNFEKTKGSESLDYLTCLNNLSAFYLLIGNYEKAQQLLLECIAVSEKAMGKFYLGFERHRSNLATAYFMLGKFEESEQLIHENLLFLEQKVGKENEAYIREQINLSNLYTKTGESEKALTLLDAARITIEETTDQLNFDYAIVLNRLGKLYFNKGQMESVESLYMSSSALMESVFGIENNYYVASLFDLAVFYASTNKEELAFPLFEKISKLNQALISNALFHLSEDELSKYIQIFTIYSHAILHCTEKARHTDLEMSEICFDNSLFIHGLLLKSLNHIRNLASTDSTSAGLFKQLKIYERQLAKAYVTPLLSQSEGLVESSEEKDRDLRSSHERNIAELKEKANIVEKELARTVYGYAETIRQVKWQEVQKALNSNEAAIEFVNFQINFPHSSDSMMYAALLLTSKSPQPVFIPLFEERDVQNSISRKGSGDQQEFAAQLYTRGLVPHGVVNNQEGLFDLLWKPLDSLLTGIKKIYYSPAGILNKINFDAIPGRFDSRDDVLTLSEKYELVRLGSTRSVVIPDATSINPSNEIVLYGGIHYEIDTILHTWADSMTIEPVYTSSGFTYALRSVSDKGSDWNYLPGTAREIAEIARIGESVHFPVSVYQGSIATEETVKEIGREKASPRILHFATHGFFFPDPEKASTSRIGLGDTETVFKLSDNPMIRSGLILAGGNYAWQNGKPVSPEKEDGILTAYEISQMNLSNTELVVLSACETGLGDIQGNEGVYGLQRAFKIAGAKYLIMSLWQVPDRETMEFMTTFYRNWLLVDDETMAGKGEKMSIPDAFRKTQREMRDRFINPYSWAGFVLVE